MATSTPSTPKHRWRFFRAGGFDQVRLDSGADLLALGELDQKLWVALACPTTTIDFDARTLRLLDGDDDKRVRASELVTAVRWVGPLLKNADDLLKGSDSLPVTAISTDTPDGAPLARAAARVLKTLGKDPATGAVTVDEATDAVKALHASPLNGDGVIVEASTSEADLAACIHDIAACAGTAADRSGALGITQAGIDSFFAAVDAYLAWHQTGTADPATAPVKDTARARAVLAAVQAKVEDYFARCRLAAFDARAATALNREDKDFLALAPRELKRRSEEIAMFPLARVEAGRPMPLQTGVNPAWEDAVLAFAAEVVTPLLGKKTELTEADWTTLVARFDAYDAWQAKKAGTSVEKLGVERLRALRDGDFKTRLAALIAEDLAVEPVARAVGDLERLARYHRDLYRLARNFVSFPAFYGRKEKAVFQAGTLFIDQRSCDLCIRIDDAGKHAPLAAMSRAFLAYCECQRGGQKMTVACAFTAGDSDNLTVGRNGVFYDRAGRDWDATITKIVDNPISVGQAFWAPYKKLIRFIEEQTAKRAAAADTAQTSRLTEGASELGTAAETGQAKKPPAKIDIGMVAALGVAVGGLTAALGAIMQSFFGLGLWMPLGVVALILAISGPSMAVAWLKLRLRSLGPLLDANGWAMNSPARINIPFGRSLTQVAVLPPGSARDLRDPYAERRQPWSAYAAAAAVLLIGWFWFSGNADPFLPEHATRAYVFRREDPAQQLAATPAPAAAATDATATAAQPPPTAPVTPVVTKTGP